MFILTPHEDYKNFQDDSRISPSSLQKFFKCPYYYWAERVAKIWIDDDNDNFVLGSAADSLITEGREAFESSYHVAEKRTPKLKEAAKQDGITLITNKQAAIIESMFKELQRQPIYKGAFRSNGWENQKCIEVDFIDEFDGYKFNAAGRLDYFHESGIIADLKTCASLDTFRPSNYALQMGMYHEMVLRLMNLDCEVYIIAVDKTDMTRSRIFRASDETILQGKAEMKRAMEQLRACREANAWGNQPIDDSKPHECPTYSACPYGLQRRIFIF